MVLNNSIKLCKKKIKGTQLSRDSVLYFLFVITPLMDTINGGYVLSHGETGVSIGTFYRLFILVFIFWGFKFKKKEFAWLIITAYFPISSAIRAVTGGDSLVSAFTYGLKWMLPVIYILLLNHIKSSSPFNIPRRIMNVWKYLTPALLIIEYVLGIGKESYFDAGFKGLFYCTNDIGYSLTMMSIYSIYTFIFVRMNTKNMIAILLNVCAILILSTKSCIMFTGLTLVLYIFKKIKESPRKSVPIVSIIAVIVVLGLYLMKDNIGNIIGRYTSFYSQTVGLGLTFSNLMGFLTSARTYRIAGAFESLSSNFNILSLMFGWCKPIFTGAIEMDWLDVLFQHGIIGFIILFCFYIRIIMKKNYRAPFKYMIIVAMICATFSGHVLNGALPSTVYAIVVGCAIYSANDDNDRLRM